MGVGLLGGMMKVSKTQIIVVMSICAVFLMSMHQWNIRWNLKILTLVQEINSAQPSANTMVFVIGSPEQSMQPLYRTTCASEHFYLATNALFGRLLGVNDQDVLSKAFDDFREAKYIPEAEIRHKPETDPGLFRSEQQRQFLCWVSQVATNPKLMGMSESSLRMSRYVIPEDVHAMSRGGAGFVGGGLYNADMVTEALQLAGLSIQNTKRALDWGGSSGRSIAMLCAAFPHLECFLADPIRKSIEWASANLIRLNITAQTSPVSPPTSYQGNTFDLIFAISIWSHYNIPTAGMQWLQEMHRITAPGGALVITTHGYASIFSKVLDKKTAVLVKEAFATDGHFYVRAFPGNVDWDADTKNTDWGMSWVSPEWLQRQLQGQWDMKVLLNGRSDCLQDVMVLIKKP